MLRIAFDSRPASQRQDVGQYTRCLLAALHETAGVDTEIVEMHRPMGGRLRRVDVFHTPWMEGAALRSPCPTVVTLHDVDALTRRSERLRCGGVHARLRHLALQRATHVIVHSEETADDAHMMLGLERERIVVIPMADPTSPAGYGDRAAVSELPPGRPGGLADWGWQDVARATWRVYEQALSAPLRPLITRPRVA